jgi:hypothetical protein
MASDSIPTVRRLSFGRIVYSSQPDGHIWEALTVSYARRPVAARQRG